MEEFGTIVGNIMRSVVGACEVPVVVMLLIGVVFIILFLGTLIGEYFTEHRQFKVFLPRLVDELKDSIDNPQSSPSEVIKESELLLRQKKYLIELTRHRDISDEMRESLAVSLEHKERRRYEGIVKITDFVSRVAPMLGLLGTLIPLGPGIMALSTGDTETLSASLLTAFDTTSLGLMIAAVALLISTIRKRWYKDYMVSFDAAMECVLETQKNEITIAALTLEVGQKSAQKGAK